MPALHKLQHDFMAFLQSRSGDVAQFVIGDETLDTDTRLEIYRNAYSIRLTKSMETDHPVLGSYLGDELFERMAQGYISQCPSGFTSLRDFGNSLPDYLARTDPFSGNPILAEIALFERQLLFSFDAGDAGRTRLEDLQAMAPEDWPGMLVEFHPSVCTFAALWNSVECWQALKEGNTPPLATQEKMQNWLLWRGIDRLTQFQKLSAEGALMLNGLAQGKTFSGVCEKLLAIVAENQISSVAAGHLLQWVEAGIVSRVHPAQPQN